MQQVSARRNPKAGGELARHGRTAHKRCGLEHQDRPAAARQRRRADQSIVPAADDDAVVA